MANRHVARGAHVLRSAPWLPLLGVAGIAAVLLVVATLAHRSAIAWLTALLGLSVCGGAAAYVLDEEAAKVADATPMSRGRRLRWRLLLLTVPAAVALGGLLALDRVDGSTHWLRLIPLAVGSLAVGVTLAATLRRSGAVAPGDLASVVAATGVLLVSAVDPLRHWVTVAPLGESGHIGRTVALWAAVVFACSAVTFACSRDPGAGGRGALSRW